MIKNFIHELLSYLITHTSSNQFFKNIRSGSFNQLWSLTKSQIKEIPRPSYVNLCSVSLLCILLYSDYQSKISLITDEYIRDIEICKIHYTQNHCHNPVPYSAFKCLD